MARAPVLSPRPAAEAAARSWSVTLAMAETTTTGEKPLARRPATMAAVRFMAGASSTEVPPNFMMTMWGRGVDSVVLMRGSFPGSAKGAGRASFWCRICRGGRGLRR